MTMLTSLKSLFAPAPARTGGRADAQPAAGTADFAQLMGAANAASGVAEGAAPAPVPVPVPVPTADAMPTAGQGAPLATPDGAETAAVDTAGSSLPLPPAQAGSSAAGFAPMSGEAGVADEGAVPPREAPSPLADATKPAGDSAKATHMARNADGALSLSGHKAAPQVETGAPQDAQADDSEDGEDEAASAPGAPLQAPDAPSQGPVVAMPIIVPMTVPVAMPEEGAAAPAAVVGPAASATDAQAPAAPTIAQSAAVAAAEDMEMPQPAVIDDDPAVAATPQRAQAQAVSLLQLVRDHMTARRPGDGASEAGASVATDDPTDVLAGIPTIAVSDKGVAAPQGLAQAPTLASGATTPIAPPSVDLSASLGTQVVDMGVSGQWIDGLARDIAGLSANGAQGRFQINTDQLGAIQVDIRQGSDGAAVSLTVATEAAEQALRQDGDRLKLDAALTAVRISEVKIERAVLVGETVRADASGQQSNGQQSNGQGQGQSASWQTMGQGMGQGTGSGTGQNMGQSAAQSQMQGRGQGRENFMSGHKGNGDGVVLNHDQAGDSTGDPSRARYA